MRHTSQLNPPSLITRILHEEVVPKHRDGNRGQMPQRMCVDDPPPRRKVEQLERGRRGCEEREQRGLVCAPRPVPARLPREAAQERPRGK